jgi:hypothetical protein
LNSDDPFKVELLNWIDILIDGPYKKELPSKLNYVGSSNQKIHILNDKLMDNMKMDESINNVEITINDNGNIILTGFPDKDLKYLI